MSGRFSRRLAAAVALSVLVAGWAAAGEVLSTMRNVNAVPEAHGFRVEPAYDVSVAPLPTDLSAGQAFEIIRPDGRPVTIGRLFTSCTCIQLQAHKRTFAPGERAILQLRNIRPTPPAGQIYAIFVQITSPVRTTLRFDTFVQSGQPGTAGAPGAEPAAAQQPAPAAGGGAPSPAGVNTELAAQIQRELEAAEAEHLEETAAQSAETAAEAASGNAGVVRLDDGSEVTEVTGELRDELEAMLDREFAARRAEIEAGREAVEIGGQRDGGGAEELGTADLAYDLADELPDFHSAAPPAPGPAAAGLPEPIGSPVTAAIAPAPAAAIPAESPEDVARRHLPPSLTMAPGPVVLQPAPAQPDPAAAPQRDPDAAKPVQAISLITLGVRDMPAATRFYEGLGWRRAARGKYDQTVFFQLQGQILALYPIADLLREQNMQDAMPSPGGITLAMHVHDKADVWTLYQRFIDAGGQSLRAPAEMASGAVSSYVADPDGNAWEISWVPQFRIDEDGGLWLP